MALQLAFTAGTGFTGNYWKIIGVNLDFSHSRSTVVIGLYKDIAARLAGAEHMIVRTYHWKSSNNPFNLGSLKSKDPQRIAYEVIKTMKRSFIDPTLKPPEADELIWNGATDV